MTGAEGFAAVPNWLIRDESVSGPAIAVYGALASHSGKGGIHPSQLTLAKEARLGARRTRDAINELEQLGVVERVRRSTQGGRASDAYLLHPNGPDQQPAPDAGSGSQPAPADAATGTTQHDVPLIEEEPIKKPAGEYFDEFWSAYPRHMAKAAARTKFLALAKKLDPQLLVDGARRYAADPNLPEKQYIPYPTTWLTQGRWEDEALPPRGDREQVRDVGDGEEWMLR